MSSNQADRAWLPEQQVPGVALVTASEFLREEISRIATAASTPLRIAASFRELAGDSDAVGTVLVGSDISEVQGGRWASLVLIGLAGEGDALWEQAAALGAERVAVLPEAAGWLAEFLAKLETPGTASNHIVGVLGGCGGAGASTLAAWLACASGASGRQTLLVDADPWGGGLDMAIGAEDVPGIRWEDMFSARGSINPSQLQRSLPETGGFSLLSFRQRMAGDGEADSAVAAFPSAVVPGEVGNEVFAAARRGYSLTVVDLGRSEAGLEAAERHCDSLVLVVPARVRAAAAARLLSRRIRHQPLSLVVRGPLLAGADAHLVSESAGYPLTAYWRPERGLRAASENGQLLSYCTRRSVRRLTDSLLQVLPEDLGRTAA
ncbi:CpaE-like family protein [Arthrobacter monumenti]